VLCFDGIERRIAVNLLVFRSPFRIAHFYQQNYPILRIIGSDCEEGKPEPLCIDLRLIGRRN
jgi:hypothetical protein